MADGSSQATPSTAGAGDVIPSDAAGCARMFAEFARTATRRAPFYSRLAAAIARDEDVAGLLMAAPSTQRQPVLLLACVHALLLEDPSAVLARWYPNLTPSPEQSDPLEAFRDHCARHADRLTQMLATRHTQTNEIGRCALLLPALAVLAAEVGPLAHVDVGTSAGLNLLLPRCHYRYEPGGDVSPEGRPGAADGGAREPTAAVVLPCSVRGEGPIPAAVPPIVRSAGIDARPIDVTDPDEARWLEACVWPDQKDRFERLRAALALARDVGLDVRRGDAVADTAAVATELAAAGHPVITNTWVLNYLTAEQRTAYVATLEALGARLDVSWVFAESPVLVRGVPVPAGMERSEQTVLTVVRWRSGQRHVEHLGACHPHGYWLHWW